MGGEAKSSNAVVKGIVIVALFAVATLYAGHERMHYVPGVELGNGPLIHRPVSLSGEAFFEGTAYASLASGSRGELESKELQHMLASVHSVLQSVQVEQRGISNGLKQVPRHDKPLEPPKPQQPRVELSSLHAPLRAPQGKEIHTKQHQPAASPPRSSKPPALAPKPPALVPKPPETPPKPDIKPSSSARNEDEIVVKLEKPFTGSFVINVEKRKASDLLKQPKHLSAEGRINRARRGNKKALGQTMKWEHLGPLDPKWIEAGIVPVNDEPRMRWLPNGPGIQTAKCAVVGNGGGLLGMAAGAEIDSADIVIRFNGGPVRGFERHVGHKTTYRLTNSDHFAFSDIGDEVILQHVTNTNGTATATRIAKALIKKRANGKFGESPQDLVTLRLIDPDFHYLVMTMFSYGAPSNGFYGTVFAGELCASVTLYGFQKVWKGTKLPYHYYNDVEPNDSQFGRDNTEAVFFSKWIEASNERERNDPRWQTWRSQSGWPLMDKFVFAEERHSNLPRLDIDLKTVPWVDTGFVVSNKGRRRALRLRH